MGKSLYNRETGRRTCSSCLAEEPACGFSPAKKSADGRMNICRDCNNAYLRGRRKKKLEMLPVVPAEWVLASSYSPRHFDKGWTNWSFVYIIRSSNEVLYVGCSSRYKFNSRIQEHKGKHWWAEVTQVDVSTEIEDRTKALALESQLIETLNPLYNVQLVYRLLS